MNKDSFFYIAYNLWIIHSNCPKPINAEKRTLNSLKVNNCIGCGKEIPKTLKIINSINE